MAYTNDKPILTAGRTCWRIEEAERLAFLVDGAAYFSALRQALLKARRSILILGWDIDSRLRLVRDEQDDGYPVELGPFLNAVVKKNRRLRAHVLCWDFAMIYALEREWLPLLKLNWRTHRHLYFRMHDRLPLGASFHQKVVVIDDCLAFVGGIDLSKWRWDTSDHQPHHPQRIDPNGHAYPPFHDVQVMVAGQAATALGELARMHWQQATGKSLKTAAPRRPMDCWPDDHPHDLENVSIGIARTLPPYESMRETRESEQLYLEGIRHARRAIYIENQYLTAQSIGDALAARLKEKDGPEVVLVLPYKTGGWLEQNTMDVLRGRMLKRLRAADHEGRLRVWYPHIPSEDDQSLSLHSKIMVVDDRLLRIGSSNASNRSMGLDTECDLAIESDGEECASAIATFRNRLLAEHLDCSAYEVADAVAKADSLIGGIESLRKSGRSLYEMDESLDPDLDAALPRSELLDPERPMDAERLVGHLIGQEEERRSAGQQLLIGSMLLLSLIFLAAAWHWTPLGQWLNMRTLTAAVEMLRQEPLSPLLVIAAFILTGFLVMPVTLLIMACAWVFGPVTGFVYALGGAFASAISTYAVGHLAGRHIIRRLTNTRINRISRYLGRQGLLTIIMARMIPVAPFTIINMVAGASHIRFRAFALGTLIGMTPGTLAIVIIITHLEKAIETPKPANLVMVSLVISIIALAVLALRRLLLRRVRKRQEQENAAD